MLVKAYFCCLSGLVTHIHIIIFSLYFFFKGCVIDMVLPTGAMGNITGGFMAKQMGVPIGMLCAGVNINGKVLGMKFSARTVLALIQYNI